MQPNIQTITRDGALGALPPSSGRPLALVGACSAGPLITPTTYARDAAVIATFGAGPLVEDACYHIQRTGKPVLLVRTAATNVGGYGTPVDEVEGTSVVTVVTGTEPHDSYDFIFEVVTGGTRGTAGITYRTSLDNGTNWSPVTALGVATGITAPGNVGLAFAAGTLLAGDRFSVRTTAPRWNDTDLLAALNKLGQSSIPWEQVSIVGAVNATSAGVIETWMQGLAAKSRNRNYLANTRLPNAAESEAAYLASLNTDFESFMTKHGAICAGAADIVSAVSGRNYRAPILRAVASRSASVDVHINIAELDLGALAGVRIRDELGNAKHHDESLNPGLDDAGFITLRTWDDEPGVYINRPLLKSGPSSDFQIIPHRRVMNAGIDAVLPYLRRRLSKMLLIDATSGFILELDRIEIEKRIVSALSARLLDGGRASAVSAAVSKTDNILSTKTLTVEFRIVPLGYPEAIVLTVGFLNPALVAQAA